jgi:16S rRNA (cytosine1402-N4)-methyltransferase
VHTSVLLREVLDYLAPQPDADVLLLDGTIGEGGHTEAFLEKHPRLRVIGVDRDREILARAEKRLSKYISEGRLELVCAHSLDYFGDRGNFAGGGADLILLDLGVSRFHYELSGRGFSFSKAEPLDMRLTEGAALRAADIIANYREDELADMLYNNGGERASRRIARFICEERRKSPIADTSRLASIIHGAIGARSGPRGGTIDSATRTFAALRIEVNGELENLTALLGAAFSALKQGGKLGVISFHSTEDRIVKNVFKSFAKSDSAGFDNGGGDNESFNEKQPIMKGRVITKKPIAPTLDEIRNNPASRSAKLRVVERLCN